MHGLSVLQTEAANTAYSTQLIPNNLDICCAALANLSANKIQVHAVVLKVMSGTYIKQDITTVKEQIIKSPAYNIPRLIKICSSSEPWA